MENNSPKYFLAANSCEGFVSCFEDSFAFLSAPRVYLIKGGPGTGKSTFMRYVAKRACECGLSVTLCPCSSDPDSLDGVIIHETETVLLDATAPHALDPKYPAAREEIINLGEFWDTDKIFKSRDAVIAATHKNSAFHKTAARYLAAAGKLMRENLQLQKDCIRHERLAAFAERLCKGLLPPPAGKGGNMQVRFLEGITPKGIVSFEKSVESEYKTVLPIEDKIGGVSNELITAVCNRALAAGLDVIALKSPFLPSALCDHILIPELSLAVVSENGHLQFNTAARRIHSRRFIELPRFKACRNRMIFNKRIIRELLGSAADTLSLAKKSHDELERFYVEAMDFEALSQFAAQKTDSILKI